MRQLCRVFLFILLFIFCLVVVTVIAIGYLDFLSILLDFMDCCTRPYNNTHANNDVDSIFLIDTSKIRYRFAFLLSCYSRVMSKFNHFFCGVIVF